MYHAPMAVHALARSWRPATFDEVIGQDAVVTTLKNALGSDTLGQAYLFSGLRGVGKTTVARLLAKAVNCVDGPTTTPCGQCDSCTEVAAGASLDVVELDGATHTQVDKVRDLQELLRFSPTRDRFRVVIIDEVHMLSRSAFNALLKSIEEPPEYVIWIFATTEAHKVPATIQSRCQQLEFRPVPAEIIGGRMEAIAQAEGFRLEPGATAMLARAAQGSVRDGLSLLDQLRAFSDGDVDERAVAEVLGIPEFDVLLELVRTLIAGDAPAGLQNIRSTLASGHDPAVVYQELGRLLRELVHLAADASLGAELTPEQREAAAAVATTTGLGALTRMIGLWLDHEFSVNAAANRDLALEVACLRLARWTAVRRIEALLADPGAAAAPADGSASGSSKGGGGAVVASAADRLGDALWAAGERRLAGAIQAAHVVAEDAGPVRIELEPGPMAALLAAETSRAALDRAVRAAYDADRSWQLNVVGEGPAEGDSLRRRAEADPDIGLVRSVIGGDLVQVLPDDAPN
jgi:DNA polymerase-3 subunit gamma/tau